TVRRIRIVLKEDFLVHQPKRFTLITVACVRALTVGIAFAQAPKPAPSPLAPKPAQKPTHNSAMSASSRMMMAAPDAPMAQELTPSDLETFFDGFLPQQIIKGDIAGVVIAVVKDGKPIFEKGYGYSDVATKKPVSPQDTLFRPGSISKTFTWTAVMQQ